MPLRTPYSRGLLPAAVALLALAAPAARAQFIAYDNLASGTSSIYLNAGATNQSGNTITQMVADDITFAPGTAGLTVNQFSFSVANLNATALTVRPRVRFYASDGTGSGPGTYLNGFSFNPISFAANSYTTVNTANLGAVLTIPANRTIWAGIVFDDNTGGTGVTAAQLNNFGQAIAGVPSVGSSADVFFKTTAAGSFVANNPAGSFLFFGGTPVANFSWRFFTSSAAAPEPGAFALLGLGLIPLALHARRRK